MENNNSNIKAVVFDVGGVIELSDGKNILDQIAEMTGIPSDELKKEYWKHNHLSNVENMAWEDMIVRVVEVFDKDGAKTEKVRQFVRDYNASKAINADILKLFPEIHGLGMKVGIFSNATSQLREHLQEKGVAPLVDEIVVSGEIGYQKPSKEAFEILFQRLGLRPAQVVFIDDSPKSLETAAEIGYIPVLFKGNEQLVIDLKNLGISLK